MVIELLQALLDLCFRLFDSRKEVNHRFFEDHVAPIEVALLDLHNAYLRTFTDYRTIIVTSKHRLDDQHPVFAQLRRDALANVHKLAALSRLSRRTVNSKLLLLKGRLESYLRCNALIIRVPESEKELRAAIDKELRDVIDKEFELFSVINVARDSTDFTLKELLQDGCCNGRKHEKKAVPLDQKKRFLAEAVQKAYPRPKGRYTERLKRKRMVEVVDAVILDLQHQYDRVVEEIHCLRERLILNEKNMPNRGDI